MMEATRPIVSRPLPARDLEHILSILRDDWEDARGARIFLTGGTGFFGRWLTESFLDANEALGLKAELVVLTRRVDAVAASAPHLAGRPGIKFLPGDVRDFEFPDGDFSHIIHGATTSASQVDPLENLAVIVDGTRRVLEFAGAHGARKFLLTSSGAVYGRQPSELTHVPEEFMGGPDTMAPASNYGEGKRMAELLGVLHQSRSGLEVKIARCFAFVGPALPIDAHFAIGNFLRDVLQGRSIEIQGDGRPWRSYLYAADLAIWLWTILFRGTPGRAFNVGSENAVTIADIAHAAAQLTEPACVVNIALPPGSEPSPRYVPSTRRAQQELGLREYIPLAEGLRRTFEWHSTPACTR